MKRVILLAVSILLVSLAWPAVAAEPVGFVAASMNDARIVRGAETIPARIGLQVKVGDRLETGVKSRLKILLSDDSVLALGSRSEVELNDHLFLPDSGTRTTRMRLVGGTLRALVQKMVGGVEADFEVRTGTAVAGVRGTEFALLANGRGTRLVTFSGAVQWAGRGGDPVLVEAGQGSELTGDQASKPEALAAVDLRAVRQATDATQAPQALAWNLTPRDRLTRRAGSRTGTLELDQQQVDKGSQGNTTELDFNYEGGRGQNLHPSGEDAFHGRFAGDTPDVDGDLQDEFFGRLTGEWQTSADWQPSIGARNGDFQLNIRIQRSGQ